MGFCTRFAIADAHSPKSFRRHNDELRNNTDSDSTVETKRNEKNIAFDLLRRLLVFLLNLE